MSPEPEQPSAAELPHSHVQMRRPLQLIWLIPVVALGVAAYLGWQAISERGPMITLTFRTGDGLVADQTPVKHKAVDLGRVERISLSNDMSHVEVRIRMRREAVPELTDTARFWVVRPRLSLGNVSGLDTLLSGGYIEMDPGSRGGKQQLSFTGLEEPPAVRSDEPGQTYKLTADRIGSLSSGSPVFYRDIDVGEVLGYDLGPNGDNVTVNVFVRSPFDKFVHAGTNFWNASGIAVDLGANGVQLRLESLAAVLSGGVAFDTTADARATPVSPPGATFPLYKDQDAGITADFRRRIPMVSYFQGTVRGLAAGAPVELFGIQIGTVTRIHLQFDPTGAATPRVAVHFEVQPERMMDPRLLAPGIDPVDVTRRLVRRGLHAGLATANYLTGQLVLQMVFTPGDATSDLHIENGEIVLPSQAGGLDSITAGLDDIIQKLNRVPIEQLVQNLNETVQSLHDIANGPELKQTLQSAAAAMASVNELAHSVDADAGPALKRLPDIAKSLQTAVDRAGALLGSTDAGYGANSEFRRDLERLLQQVSDTARSVRLLADYLDQHPEALLRGRTDQAGQGR
jgi:paraquat-inducible protein B